jgi:hypothetical protein
MQRLQIEDWQLKTLIHAVRPMQRANYQCDYMSVLTFNKIMIRLVGLKHLLNKKYNRITRNLSQVLCIDEFNDGINFQLSISPLVNLNK